MGEVEEWKGSCAVDGKPKITLISTWPPPQLSYTICMALSMTSGRLLLSPDAVLQTHCYNEVAVGVVLPMSLLSMLTRVV